MGDLLGPAPALSLHTSPLLFYKFNPMSRGAEGIVKETSEFRILGQKNRLLKDLGKDN